MRIMTDTNVIISAILKKGSICDEVLNDICENHELILCDYIINESYDVAKRKFPNKIYVLDKLFSKLRYNLILAPNIGKIPIRDIKDQPILNAVIKHDVEILISGDNHFLELNLKKPKILSPTQFKNTYINY